MIGSPSSSVLLRRRTIPVLIGEAHITKAPHRLEAVLGSRIGLVICDRVEHLAAMAHVLLPVGHNAPDPAIPAKYANHAVPCLVNGLLDLGVERKRLSARLAGGARMFEESADGTPGVGASNVAAIHQALRQNRIPVLEEDTGGTFGRRALFDTWTMSFRVHVMDDNSRYLPS